MNDLLLVSLSIYKFNSGQEYKTHIKCISEEEKYSGKGFVAKPGQNKNERKQTEWVAMVQNVVLSVGNTNEELTNALQRISQYENIPRKKPKFMVCKIIVIETRDVNDLVAFQNFLKNILGNRVNPRIAEQSWDLISKALEEQKAKQALENKPKPAEEKVAVEVTSNKRKNDIENEIPVNGNKKSKKDVEEKSQVNGSSAQANDTINSEGGEQSSLKVKWCTIGKTILRSQDDKELSLKKFQKKIIAEYLNRVGNAVNTDESVEVLWSKCQKKLSKNPKFKIHKEKIKLVS